MSSRAFLSFPSQLPPDRLGQKLLPLGGAEGLQRRVPHQGLEGGAFQQRAEDRAVLLHRCRAGLLLSGGSRRGPDRLLLRHAPGQPAVPFGRVVALAPEIGKGDAEIVRQLPLLVLSGRLAPGLELLYGRPGKAQGGGEGGGS